MWFENVGKQDAEDWMVAIKLDFLPSPPSQSQRAFADSKFVNMTPSTLRPLSDGEKPIEAPNVNTRRPIYRKQYAALEAPEMKVYVWGEIRYKDYTRTWNNPSKFCRYAVARDILSTKNLSEGGTYDTLWENCD